MTNRLVVLLLAVAGMIALSEAHWYATYPLRGQQGDRVDFDTDAGCQRAVTHVASVNTGGGCIMLCTHFHCGGDCVRVADGGGDCADHGDLRTCNFRYKTFSMKGC